VSLSFADDSQRILAGPVALDHPGGGIGRRHRLRDPGQDRRLGLPATAETSVPAHPEYFNLIRGVLGVDVELNLAAAVDAGGDSRTP
jgi:hypothetical protein